MTVKWTRDNEEWTHVFWVFRIKNSWVNFPVDSSTGKLMANYGESKSDTMTKLGVLCFTLDLKVMFFEFKLVSQNKIIYRLETAA